MADEEQLGIIRQGPEIWNAWRQKHPDSRADLRRADLRKAKLSGAELNRADLRCDRGSVQPCDSPGAGGAGG
jgi:hypothetical protein